MPSCYRNDLPLFQKVSNGNNQYGNKKIDATAVAAPARCSWQGKVRSLVASGRAVNISIYEQRFMSSDVSNAFYCIKQRLQRSEHVEQ